MPTEAEKIDILGKEFLETTTAIVAKGEKSKEKAKRKAKKATSAKQKAEELMNKIIPREIVSQLGNGALVKPQHYEDVTILVARFADFDHIISNSDPMQVYKC